MKRRILMMVLVLLCVLAFAGCGCEHEWVEANCDTPKTCSLCEETEGAPLGHTWKAATCDAPKTCETCNLTQGSALEHVWEEATCTLPKMCASCRKTEGDPLGHSWEEATTDAPKTCTRCQSTEGSKLETDPRFTTASTKELYGKWVGEIVIPGDVLGTTGYVDELPCNVYFAFSNVGDVTVSMELSDEEAFKDAMKQMVIDIAVESLEAEGISKEEADEAMQQVYGMTMQEYAAATVEEMDVGDMVSQFNSNMVYYVEDGVMYSGLSWDSEFTSDAYYVEDGVLYIESDGFGEEEMIPLTKVE